MFIFEAVFGFLKALISPIEHITTEIQKTRQEKLKADTDQARIAADERIKTLEQRKEVLVAEAGTPINQFTRTGLAIGPMIYLNKVFLWDKVIGSFLGHSCYKGECSVFNTDALDDNLWKIVVAVVSFYFLYDIGTKALRAVRG